MYKIEKRESGYLLFFSNKIGKEEMQKWYEESLQHLKEEQAREFPVIIDMRDLQPLPPEAHQIMVAGQGLYKNAGMKRSAVIVNNAATVGQFQAIAKKSGIYDTERYFDGSENDAIHKAIKWAKEGIEL